MSLDTQIALARPPRGESSHLSRAARQVVPPFLQKLYEIVNDPANEELIRWSENGDSFYVLNHEKFAREVLGRWFKHQKFASFVRQLNMYGFHKIPHLQQGVLKSDTDTEPWHFEHPNFHRGQPDLLCLIQRKKQPTHGNNDDTTPSLDVHDPNAAPNGLAGLPPGQVMDMNSLVNGIAAIKRHQQAISSDLSTLKQSNDALWKEAIAARQRHAKHQDTINRILKFLAGVFGHTDESPHPTDGSHTPPQVTPRIRQRLMIGDSRASVKGRHVDIVEVEDDEADFTRHNRSRTPFGDRYATIETPDTSASSPSVVESVAPSEAFPPISENAAEKTNTPPIRPTEILTRSNSANSNTPGLTPNGANPFPTPPGVNGSATPFGAPNGQNPTDSMWQAAIQHMMQSPGQFQRVVQAFANQQQPYANLPPDGLHGNGAALSPYDAGQTEYARWFNQPVASSSAAPVSQALLAHADDSPMQLLMDESNRLQRSYRDATEIDADMDMLQTSINSLIQNLGIDPGSLEQTPSDHSTPPSVNGVNGTTRNGSDYSNPLTPDGYAKGVNGSSGISMLGPTDTTQPDYLLDSLLSQIDRDPGVDSPFGGGGVAGLGGAPDYQDVTSHYDHSTQIDGTSIDDASTEQLTAFLDEASSASSEATPITPVTPANGSPLVGTAAAVAAAHKRKSVDVPLPAEPDLGMGRKVKRKR